MYTQIRELQRNPHVVVGTPGRLKDLIDRKALKLERFSMVILDEADLMLDMGFINDIKEIISYLPKRDNRSFSQQHCLWELMVLSKALLLPSDNFCENDRNHKPHYSRSSER